jgi:signal peptidase II
MVSNKHVFFLVIGLFFLDQVTKLFARVSDVNTNLFNYVLNTGATLGVLPGSNAALIVISVFAALLLAVAVTKTQGIDQVLYGVVLAGVLGNGLDRILYGGVVDFLRFFDWFIFNIADIYITCAVALLLLLELPWIRRYF